MQLQARLRIGIAILTIAAVSLLAASFAIITPWPGPSSKVGRHLLAGALANASVAILLTALALIPIRRGERWAFWLCVVVALVYGTPVFIVDATYVARDHLLRTLLPQAIGLLSMTVGLAMIGSAIFSADRSSSGRHVSQ